MAGKGDGKGVQRRQVNTLIANAIANQKKAEEYIAQANKVCDFFGLDFNTQLAKVKAELATPATAPAEEQAA